MRNIDKELYRQIGKQLKRGRENLGISLDTLTELIGGIKTKSTLKRYEDGMSRMELDILQLLCDKLNLDYKIVVQNAKDTIACDSNNEVTLIEDKNIIFDDYFPLHYCTNLSAGTLEELLEAEPDAIVYVPIKYQMMKKRLHAFKVNGDSMNNIIEDGSIVIAEDVKHLSRIKDGTIVVAWCNGEATVKRLYYNDIQITLMPDSSNKVHKPILINTEIDTVHIIGRVIWHMNPDDMEERY